MVVSGGPSPCKDEDLPICAPPSLGPVGPGSFSSTTNPAGALTPKTHCVNIYLQGTTGLWILTVTDSLGCLLISCIYYVKTALGGKARFNNRVWWEFKKEKVKGQISQDFKPPLTNFVCSGNILLPFKQTLWTNCCLCTHPAAMEQHNYLLKV